MRWVNLQPIKTRRRRSGLDSTCGKGFQVKTTMIAASRETPPAHVNFVSPSTANLLSLPLSLFLFFQIKLTAVLRWKRLKSRNTNHRLVVSMSDPQTSGF